MKRSTFTQEQLIGVLKEHQAGASAADLCCRHGISDATFHAWRSKCGGMEVSDDRKLKGLAEENARLKRLPGGVDAGPVDLAGDTSKKLVTPSSRRSPVTWAMKQKGHSQRRACEMVGLEPKTYPYASKRSGNGEVRARLRVLAAARRRLGCRRLHVLLAREGILLNHKRLFRLHRELDRIAGLRGCRPAVIVSDNGTELTSHAILRWQEEHSVLWLMISAGSGARATKQVAGSHRQLQIRHVTPIAANNVTMPTHSFGVRPSFSSIHETVFFPGYPYCRLTTYYPKRIN